MRRRTMVPPFLSEIVISAIRLFDGAAFTAIEQYCRSCDGPLKRHDIKKKQFATLVQDQRTSIIFVSVARYRCRACGRLWYADEPFYPGTRHGVPVVDLAVAIASREPYHHTARILAGLGILLDRGTIRHYAARRMVIPSTEMYGIAIPMRIMNLSALVAQDRTIEGAELLTALALPPTDRAPL